MTRANPLVDAVLPRRLLDVAEDRRPVGDRLRLRPGLERVAEGVHVGVGADPRVAEEVPGAADRVPRLEEGERLVRAVAPQVAAGADAGQAGSDDQDVEVLGRHAALSLLAGRPTGGRRADKGSRFAPAHVGKASHSRFAMRDLGGTVAGISRLRRHSMSRFDPGYWAGRVSQENVELVRRALQAWAEVDGFSCLRRPDECPRHVRRGSGARMRAPAEKRLQIGLPRFELGTSPTRTERATRLRHSPWSDLGYPVPRCAPGHRPGCAPR